MEKVLLQTFDGKTVTIKDGIDSPYICLETIQLQDASAKAVEVHSKLGSGGVNLLAFAFTFRDALHFLCVEDYEVKVKQTENPLNEKKFLFMCKQEKVESVANSRWYLSAQNNLLTIGTKTSPPLSPLTLKMKKMRG